MSEERDDMRRALTNCRASRSYWYVRYHEEHAAKVEIERRLVALLAERETLPGEEADHD